MYGLEFVRRETRYGAMFVPKADTVIGRSLQMYGEWAEHEIAVLSSLIADGGTIVDVGANIGTHALAFAARFPGSRILAIEPQPAPFAAMCASAFINACGNIHAFNMAASDTDGLIYMDVDYSSLEWNLGAVNLTRESGKGCSPKAVPLMTLDRLAPRDDVRLLKIDVEGMEADVIRGARQLIARCRPVIYFEVLEMTPLHASSSQLEALGYELRWLETSAFNPLNHNGVPENIWWLGEVGVLAMPSADDPRVADLPKVTGSEDEPPRKAYAVQLAASAELDSEP